ncbi:MAG TPA: hypothetical protein VMM13_14665, partial [Euzebya sp.]|nr:hypothetical protein [Euzebya sp.]
MALGAAWMLLVALAPAVAGQDGVAGTSDLPATRLAGGDRVATGEGVAAEWTASGGRTDVVVVVPQGLTAVALASAGLAGHHGGLTMLSATPPRPSTVAAVTATGARRVIVAGGD